MKPAIWLVAGVLVTGCAAAAAPAVKPGDVIFHTSRSAQSQAIQRATNSPYSHMGIVLLRDGKPFVLEAIETVRYTPLEAWIARGVGGRYVIKRLKDADRRLGPESIDRLREAARPFVGKPYDAAFGWSDDKIYCSELVWKLYQRALGLEIGRLQRLREFRLDDPVVRTKLRERYGDAVPLDETVISPGEMFESPLLVTVVSTVDPDDPMSGMLLDQIHMHGSGTVDVIGRLVCEGLCDFSAIRVLSQRYLGTSGYAEVPVVIKADGSFRGTIEYKWGGTGDSVGYFPNALVFYAKGCRDAVVPVGDPWAGETVVLQCASGND